MGVGFISKEYRRNIWVWNKGLRISVLGLGGCVEFEKGRNERKKSRRNNGARNRESQRWQTKRTEFIVFQHRKHNMIQYTTQKLGFSLRRFLLLMTRFHLYISPSTRTTLRFRYSSMDGRKEANSVSSRACAICAGWIVDFFCLFAISFALQGTREKREIRGCYVVDEDGGGEYDGFARLFRQLEWKRDPRDT